MRIRLTLAYNGSAWHGWQIQERANPPPTIQGAVEKALFGIYQRKIRIFGAGRTDAGVHAHAQEAHCDVPYILRDMRSALNAMLPMDIRILAAKETAPWFHARKDAISKTYIYQFWRDPAFIPPSLVPFAWNCGPLDVDAMEKFLPFLRDSIDFASFQNAGSDVDNTVRKINFIHIKQLAAAEFYPPHLPPLRLVINADGFLKQMVRNIAGALVWAGRRKLSADDFAAFIQQKSRASLPSPTAPACGLALAAIQYPNEQFYHKEE